MIALATEGAIGAGGVTIVTMITAIETKGRK